MARQKNKSATAQTALTDVPQKTTKPTAAKAPAKRATAKKSAKSAHTSDITPQYLSAKELGLGRHALPHSIIEVIATLNRAGFVAYIVGGGVRDSLLGLEPKDFDAVTNARPHEIKDVFGSRCRIIGKRFQLAHVYSGREMIEVATFRATPTGDNHTTDGGMIVRDNVWGDIADDFVRRDFSINALYYDPIKAEVQDFCGALQDIQNKTLRLLGKPALRIEEDPVRLLRALRFKAKLGFEFDKALAKQFSAQNWQLLEQVSAHRLYDETQKMFAGGYLYALLPMLYQYGAMKMLLAHAEEAPTPLMMAVAKSSDERVLQGRGANPAYFYATLLWDSYLHHLEKFTKKLPLYEAQVKAAARTIDRQRTRTAIPRFAEEFINQIWLLQPKLSAPRAKEIHALMTHPRFRAAYDFLVAREAAENNPKHPTNGMGAWWTQFILFDDKARQNMVEELSGGTRRRRKKDQSTDDGQSNTEFLQIQQLSLNDDALNDNMLNDNALNHTAPSRAHNTAHAAPKPLFEAKNLFEVKNRNKQMHNPIPSVLHAVHYTDEDFAKLLMDKPFVPARRKHKTRPSTRQYAANGGA